MEKRISILREINPKIFNKNRIIILSLLYGIGPQTQSTLKKRSLLSWGILLGPGLRNLKILTTLFILTTFVSILSIYHFYGVYRGCYKCDIPFNWGECSGFRTIQTNFKKYKLRNILKLLEDYSNRIKEKRDKKKNK